MEKTENRANIAIEPSTRELLIYFINKLKKEGINISQKLLVKLPVEEYIYNHLQKR